MRVARGAGAVLGAVLALGATVAGPVAPPAAADPGEAAVVRWSPSLADGDPVGVRVDGRGAQPVPGTTTARADGAPRPAGLLTLPARRLDTPVDRVTATPDPPSAGTVVDVRGLRPDGVWTEWITAAAAEVPLPAAVTAVQARLVLTAPDPGTDAAAVRGLTLAAFPAAPSTRARTAGAAVHHRVFATREGLVGGTTANGHVIVPGDLFVALPSRRALAPRDTGDYSVKLCAPTGRCAFAPVWDVGPWNTRDDYWNPPGHRESWPDLPQGVPQAQAARAGHNGGRDQFGRTVRNPAGIDLADGLFADALGLTDNAWIEVDYLWTGDSPLGTVAARVDLRAAPRPDAPVVGLAAAGAAVPLQCAAGGWLRVGPGEFVPAAAVTGRRPPACPAVRSP